MTARPAWLSLLVLVLTLVAGPALAGRLVATGKIEIIDAINRSFVLSGGQAFSAGPKVKLSKRKIGDDVVVIYEIKSDVLLAVDVRRVPFALPTHISSEEQK